MSDATQGSQAQPEDAKVLDPTKAAAQDPIFLYPDVPPIRLSELEPGKVYKLTTSKGAILFRVVAIEDGVPECFVLRAYNDSMPCMPNEQLWLLGWVPTRAGYKQGITVSRDEQPGDEACLVGSFLLGDDDPEAELMLGNCCLIEPASEADGDASADAASES